MNEPVKTGFLASLGVVGGLAFATIAVVIVMLFGMCVLCGGCMFLGSQAPTPPPEPVYVAPTPEEHSAIAEEAGRKAMAEEAAAKRLGMEVVEEE